jgi:hypothetical protein
MLAHVVCECWHALVRDVLAMGYRIEDMFTTLKLREMVSIVVAAPPGSSVRWYLDKGWTREAQLLADMNEQRAGVMKLEEPYDRVGLERRQEAEPPASSGGKFFQMEAIPWEEAERRDKIRYSGEFKPKGPTRSRALSAAVPA